MLILIWIDDFVSFVDDIYIFDWFAKILEGAFTMTMKKGDLWSNEIWLNVVWMWCCIQYYNEIFIKLSYKLNYKYVLSVSTFRMHWYRLDEQSCQISTIYIILFEKLLTGGDFFFILNQHERVSICITLLVLHNLLIKHGDQVKSIVLVQGAQLTANDKSVFSSKKFFRSRRKLSKSFNTRNVKSEGRNTEKNYGYIVAVVAISVVAGICVIVELAYGVSSTLTY